MVSATPFQGCCAGVLLSGFYSSDYAGQGTDEKHIAEAVARHSNIPFMQANITTTQKKIFGPLLEKHGFKELAKSRGMHGQYGVHIYFRLSDKKGKAV